jgi:hypothetical protein
LIQIDGSPVADADVAPMVAGRLTLKMKTKADGTFLLGGLDDGRGVVIARKAGFRIGGYGDNNREPFQIVMIKTDANPATSRFADLSNQIDPARLKRADELVAPYWNAALAKGDQRLLMIAQEYVRVNPALVRDAVPKFKGEAKRFLKHHVVRSLSDQSLDDAMSL